MADLGYVDHERLLRLKARCVHILMRLKASQDPRIARVRVGRGDKRFCRGMKLDEALATGALDFEKGRLDVDVVLAARVDGKRVEGTFRVVGIAPTDGGEDRYYLTLNRAVPMILALRMRGQNVDLAEMERRMLLLAKVLGKSRRQRRERSRKAKRAGIAADS
ncbi:hypothetical protein WME73_41300 [Sorangium sp. So ce302]|uniref:hypothetical protein n=1 Tax=unclassified Sorangium TaxID=2621164 RepID=UPI003F5EDDCA